VHAAVDGGRPGCANVQHVRELIECCTQRADPRVEPSFRSPRSFRASPASRAARPSEGQRWPQQEREPPAMRSPHAHVQRAPRELFSQSHAASHSNSRGAPSPLFTSAAHWQGLGHWERGGLGDREGQGLGHWEEGRVRDRLKPRPLGDGERHGLGQGLGDGESSGEGPELRQWRQTHARRHAGSDASCAGSDAAGSDASCDHPGGASGCGSERSEHTSDAASELLRIPRGSRRPRGSARVAGEVAGPQAQAQAQAQLRSHPYSQRHPQEQAEPPSQQQLLMSAAEGVVSRLRRREAAIVRGYTDATLGKPAARKQPAAATPAPHAATAGSSAEPGASAAEAVVEALRRSLADADAAIAALLHSLASREDKMERAGLARSDTRSDRVEGDPGWSTAEGDPAEAYVSAVGAPSLDSLFCAASAGPTTSTSTLHCAAGNCCHSHSGGPVAVSGVALRLSH
jgi:hypothetical protein